MFRRTNQNEVSKLFHGLRELDREYEIRLKPDAQSFAITTPRRIPLPMKNKVEAEVLRMN